MTSMISRACQTAACPVRERRGELRIDVLDSACMLTCRRFSSRRPDLSSAQFHFDSVQRTWRRTEKHVACGRIECSFVTRAFQTLVLTRVVNRTTQMGAFLAIRMKRAIRGPNQDGRVAAGRKVKIEAAVECQRLGSFNAHGRE